MNDKKNKKLLKTLDRVCKECEGVGQGKPFFGPVYQDDPVAEKKLLGSLHRLLVVRWNR